MFDYAIPAYVTVVWQRGVGYTRLPGDDFGLEALRGSRDLSVVATSKANVSDWGQLNCFNGYCTGNDDSCVAGDPLPPPNPCIVPSIAHRYTAGAGWVNLGSVPRVLDAATGRYYGGSRCDASVNSPSDISGNGNVVVGGAWTAGLVSNSGGVGYGLCGDIAAFRYDALTGQTSLLPVQPGTTSSRADSVNDDGTVIAGFDIGLINDPAGGYEGRRMCVWTNGTQTLIDDLSGSFDSYVVNGSGSAIAGGPNATFCLANFGIDGARLVKWTRQSNDTWTPTNLGRPVDYFDGVESHEYSGISVTAISDDGNTIVGRAEYGNPFFGGVARPFIWGATINGGVPIDFQAYLTQLDATSPLLQEGFSITRINGLSGDGNAVLVSVNDGRNTCTPPAESLATGDHGIIYLDSAGIECEAPRIAIGPRDTVSTQYTPFGVALNVFASGTFPMTYEWQREDPAHPGQWLTLSEACAGFGYGAEWDFEGVNKNQLRVGQATCGNHRDGRYRVVVSNSCGSVTSEAATVSFQQGTLITQEPENATGCRRNFVSFFAVAVSNSADLAEQWEIASSANPTEFVALTDGVNTLPDGRVADVFGSNGQFVGMTPRIRGGGSSYLLRCQFTSPCGDATSRVVSLTLCDADYNCDAVVDFFDYLDFVDAFSTMSGDSDFNGDEVIDFFDYLDFVDAFSVGC